jgi:hypothetical protein
MENWGLLTFKESLILIDPDNFTIQSKAEVALVVSHEIAHQWFGNIVTMVLTLFELLLSVRSIENINVSYASGMVDTSVVK